MAKTSCRWRPVTIIGGLASACIIGLGFLMWLRAVRQYENTLFQMRSIARAVAAYIYASEGAFPACEHSLLEAGLMEEKEPGWFLVTAREPPGSVPPHAQGMWVKFHEFDVGWSGQPIDSEGILIRSRRLTERLDAESRSLSEMLWSLAGRSPVVIPPGSMPASGPGM